MGIGQSSVKNCWVRNGGRNIDLFDEYFRRADLDRDGRCSNTNRHHHHHQPPIQQTLDLPTQTIGGGAGVGNVTMTHTGVSLHDFV